MADSRIEQNYKYDFNLGGSFFPNHNIISFASHNNTEVTGQDLVLGDLKLPSSNQVFKPSFKNNSFADIMNFYENLVTCSQWDVRENGDYETIILGRSNYFYNCVQYNWKQTGNFIDDFDKKINNIDNHVDIDEEGNVVEKKDEEEKNKKPIKSKKNTQKPSEFMDSVLDTIVNKNLSNSYIDLQTRIDKKQEDIVKNFEHNLYRIGRRKIGENIFALSKVNLISYDIKTNDVINTLTIDNIDNGLFKKDSKIGLTIIGVNDVNSIVEKPINNVLESMGEDITKSNILIQGEYMSTQLIKELELTYQGTITILFNQNVEIGDYVHLMDDTASTFGIFKVMSFEHILDKRGMITILKVSAVWDLRDPVLDTFCTSVSYELMDTFREQFAKGVDGTDNYVINKVFANYLKYVTHAVKYTYFKWISFKVDKNEIKQDDSIMNQLMFSPSIIPIKFIPMFRKGIIQMPVSLEKAFVFKDNVYKKYFESMLFFFQYKVPTFFANMGRGMLKTLNYLGDILLGTFTFNLHELFKSKVGLTEKKAQDALIGEINVNQTEFRNTDFGNYNPYGFVTRGKLGRNYNLTIGFFNTQLQSINNLNGGVIIKSSGRAKDVLDFKEKVVREKIIDIFDSTLMVEIYDGFNKENLIKDYKFGNYINNIKPRNYKSNIVGKLFENHHGSEYGVIFDNNKVKITSKIIKSGIIEKIKYKQENNNFIEQRVERNFVESTYDISYLKIPIKFLKVYWFHNFYGASDLEVDDVEIRKRFINSIFEQMMKNQKSDTGCILMGDCNLEIIDYNSSVIKHTGDSWANNYVYVIPERYKDFKSMIRNATTVDTKGETKNIFDNIVVTQNIVDDENGDYFYFSEYNYPEDNKRDVSDHIPVYIGIKVI